MKRQFIFAILAVLGFAVFWIGCQDNLARITKVVNEGAVVEQTRATALSNIIDLSRNEHPDYGVCFSESDYPTVDDDRVSLGFIDSRKEFEVTLRRLRYNTDYHFRPYVYDEQDVIYGEVQSVIINSTEGIIAYHNSITTVDFTTADVNSSISGLGSLKCIDFGLCYAIDATPTIESSTASLGELLNDTTFTTTLTGLDTWANYHVRAYGMLDSTTIIYSDEWTFNLSEPQLTTGTVTVGTSQSVTVSGSIDGLGVQSVSDHGYCWSQNANPTTSDQTVSYGPAVSTGPIGKYINNLAIQTVYHVRAYAVSGGQTYYGDDVAFTIFAPAQLNTGTVSTQSSTAALAEGNIVNNNIPLIEKGHCWSTNPNPTIADFRTQLGPLNPNAQATIASQMNNLTTNQTYYVRAYAQDSVTVFYGDVETVNAVYFSVEILPQISASSDSILAQGNLIVDGSVNITEYGHCWSYGSGLPDTSDFRYSLGPTNSSQPNFTGYATGIAANSSLNFRAYATDGTTIVYSDVMEYEPVQFSVANGSIQAAFNDSAICTADLNLTGFTTITEYGHCWVSGSGTPTINSNRYILGPSIQSVAGFTGYANGLTAGAYTFRAYATDGNAVAYGENQAYTHTNSVTFTNEDYSIDEVGVLTATAQMVIQGNVNVLEYGHCVSTNPNPTIADQRTIYGTASTNQSVSSIFNGLIHRPHYVRPYALTETGVVYGNEVNPTFQGTWVPISDMPVARGRARAGTINELAYVFGGSGLNNNLMQTREQYDPITDSWISNPDIPWGDWPLIANTNESNLFILKSSGQLYSVSGLQSQTNVWQFPYDWNNGAMEFLNGAVVISTGKEPGNGGQLYNSSLEFNTITQVWGNRPLFPGAPRWKTASFVFGSQMFFGGGTTWNGIDGESQFDFWRYNPSTLSWAQITTPNRSYSQGTEHLGYAYLISDGGQYFARYLPDNDFWIENLAPLPNSNNRSGIIFFRIGNFIYAGGGFIGSTPQPAMWKYSLQE
ncbi:hypothetical protein OAE48_02200 [Flavobacteriales bacterium]|nr:hypothetical protein [Flavobacteriales bacterium]